MRVYFLRLGAAVIDFFLLLPVFLLLLTLFLSLGQKNNTDITLTAFAFFFSCLLVTFALYKPLLMASKKHNGQTIGKQVLSIAIERKNGKEWTYKDALWREFFLLGILFFLLGWPFFFLPLLIDVIWGAFTKKGQMLHDKMAASYPTGKKGNPQS
jgi:uncharacterized RDD family membrane protein YckC